MAADHDRHAESCWARAAEGTAVGMAIDQAGDSTGRVHARASLIVRSAPSVRAIGKVRPTHRASGPRRNEYLPFTVYQALKIVASLKRERPVAQLARG
jgi:hypothetical protein